MAPPWCTLLIIVSEAAASYQGVCTDAVAGSAVTAPGWLQRPTGHHQLADKGCRNDTLRAAKYLKTPDCSQPGYTGCVAHPRSDPMSQWAVPTPAVGVPAWTHPRCANGACTIGVPASLQQQQVRPLPPSPSLYRPLTPSHATLPAATLQAISGITPSGVNDASFMVQDTTQRGIGDQSGEMDTGGNGVEGNIVAAAWADFDNDGARAALPYFVRRIC